MTPVLYILMRNDLPSMNAGKAMAQASHASNAMVHNSDCDAFKGMVKEWQGETPQGFGTLVLAAIKRILHLTQRRWQMGSLAASGDKVITLSYQWTVNGTACFPQ